jgi:hypothetical protein
VDSNIARAILTEVASGDWLDREIPEDEKELVALAMYFVEEAKLAKKDGMDNEHINAIINLGKEPTVSPPVLSAPVEPDSLKGPPGEINIMDELRKKDPAGVSEPVIKAKVKGHDPHPGRNDPVTQYHDVSPGGTKPVQKEYEGLPLPQPNPETTLDMPIDLTEVGDKAVRRLYSAFTSYYNRARWKLAVAQSNLSNATHLRDSEYRKAYKKYSTELVKNGERATKDLVDNFARDDGYYKEWEEKVVKHEQEVIHWRALYEIYGKNVEVLSRDWTMRTEQYERER